MEQNTNTIEIVKEKQRHILSGRDSSSDITYISSVPTITDKNKITGFYRRIAEECLEFCKSTLLKACPADCKYTYRIGYKHALTQNRLEVTLTVTLYDTISHKILASHNETHLWDTESQMMIKPPKSKKQREYSLQT